MWEFAVGPPGRKGGQARAHLGGRVQEHGCEPEGVGAVHLARHLPQRRGPQSAGLQGLGGHQDGHHDLKRLPVALRLALQVPVGLADALAQLGRLTIAPCGLALAL